jgi:hypothetical protein
MHSVLTVQPSRITPVILTSEVFIDEFRNIILKYVIIAASRFLPTRQSWPPNSALCSSKSCYAFQIY